MACGAWAASVATASTESGVREPTLAGPLPGPDRRVVTAAHAAELNRSCASCHSAIATEWEQSLHRRAFSNSYFARALRQENTPFCRKCHAPDADSAQLPPASAAHDGVSCVSCHLTSHGITGADGIAAVATADGSAPGHSHAGDARWRTPDVCVACHQFDFPAQIGSTAGGVSLAAMQDTHAEHAASKYADVPCQTCHMPRVEDAAGNSHADHRFAVMNDSAFLAQAARVELVERTAERVLVSLTPGRIGHAFPTGDLFRRAELRLNVNSSNAQEQSRASYVLQRVYGYDPTTRSRRVLSDTRLGPATRDDDATRVVDLALAAEGRTIHWQLVWQRMPPGAADVLGLDWTAHERVIAQGTWAPRERGAAGTALQPK